jgi:hypothetical protein
MEGTSAWRRWSECSKAVVKAHTRSALWMKRSALPLVCGV